MDIARLKACRVLPVITTLDVRSTVELVGALVKGGMEAVEITLRGPGALASISEVKAAYPDLLMAAGTVKTPEDLASVRLAGADMALSPAATPTLLAAAADDELPFIPSVATSSELMQGLELGFKVFKLFPAQLLGGPAMLKSLSGPFPEASFVPTGGVNAENFRAYLEMANVLCCGGSWMVTEELVAGQRWGEIEGLARQAMTS